VGFQTPLYELADYLNGPPAARSNCPTSNAATSGKTNASGSCSSRSCAAPTRRVMLLKTGNNQAAQAQAIEGANPPADAVPEQLLLDGQQRLTSLTQALTGDGWCHHGQPRQTLTRRYTSTWPCARGEDRIDEAVISVPGDGVVRTNFGKDIVLDLSSQRRNAPTLLPPPLTLRRS